MRIYFIRQIRWRYFFPTTFSLGISIPYQADAQLEVTKYQTEMYEEAQKYRGAELSPETSRLLRMVSCKRQPVDSSVQLRLSVHMLKRV